MKRSSERGNSLAAALRLLSRRGYSEGEIREKLGMRNFPPEEIDSAVQRLKELGYIDDASLAEQIARYRFEVMGHGRWKISEYLRRRKISGDIIEDVLSRLVTRDRAIARGVELLRKRAERGTFDISSEKGKIFRYLAGRGYPPDLAREIISEYERAERGGDEG